jgi:hypothetical protein
VPPTPSLLACSAVRASSSILMRSPVRAILRCRCSVAEITKRVRCPVASAPLGHSAEHPRRTHDRQGFCLSHFILSLAFRMRNTAASGSDKQRTNRRHSAQLTSPNRNHMYERLQTRWSEWYRLAPTAFHLEFSCTGVPTGTGDAPSIGLLRFRLVHRHPLTTGICSQESLLVVPKVYPGVQVASLYQSRGVVVQREGGKKRQAGPAHR